MVYFNCGQCGEGLRKNQVEQHMFKCRSCTFSCIDCSKDFKNDEYKSHVKCLTESERYESKSTYQQKANKGDVKQGMWMDKILRAVEAFRGSAKAKALLEKMTDFPNVPRKKAKFFNFMRNSFRSFGVYDSLLEEIWTVIESFDKKEATTANNGVNNNNTSHQNGNKRKLEETEAEDVTTSVSKKAHAEEDESSGFDWLESIKKECLKNENKQIQLEKLIKKLFKKYQKHKNQSSDVEQKEDGDGQVTVEKFEKKLNKKLKKLNKSFQRIEDSNEPVLIHYVGNHEN